MWSFSTAKCTRCHAPGGSREGTTTFLRKVIYKLLIKNTANNIIWGTVCISCLPDSLYRVKESQDTSVSCWGLRSCHGKGRLTGAEVTELPDHALEFQLQEGVCTPSHSLTSTCSYPKQILLALLPTAHPHQGRASATSWDQPIFLSSHNTPPSKRTMLTLSTLLSTLPGNQLSRELPFEVVHSSWQYLFLAPICVHIPLLTEHPQCSSQCHQHSDSWNTHRAHTTHHLERENLYLQEPHWSLSLYSKPACPPGIFLLVSMPLRVPFNFGAIYLGKFQGLESE